MLKILIRSLLLLLMFGLSVKHSFANETLILSQAAGKLISAITINGNKKTENSIIKRELNFKTGQLLSEESAQESLRKLKNLRIFEDVSMEYHQESDDTIHVHIHVSDQWTIIPIFKAGGGGGSTFYTVGAYDVNSFGKYIEVGAQYQVTNGQDGGILWFRNPRFMGHRLLVGMDLWHLRLIQPVHDENLDLLGTFNNIKNRIHFFAKKELPNSFFAGAGFDYVIDEFDDVGLSEKELSTNQENQFQIPSNAKHNFIELNFQAGELDYDRYMVEGFQANLDARITSTKLLSDDNNIEVTLKNTYFWQFDNEQNIGINVVLGHTTSRLLQNQFYMGGLQEVRGYVDRQLKGSDFWRSNIEYRVPSFRSRWLVLQHVAFTDFGEVSESFNHLFSVKSIKFASVGTGLRFISPKIYRFNARLDVARTFTGDRDFDVSFGLQQFF